MWPALSLPWIRSMTWESLDRQTYGSGISAFQREGVFHHCEEDSHYTHKGYEEL